MKRTIAVLLALMMLFSLTACGEKGVDVTGKYECVSAQFEDGSGSPDGEWVELKKGGKGTYYDDYEFNLEWKLDGEAFSGKVTFLGMEDEMNGTLKGGVLTVKYGDVDMIFAKEGAQGSISGAPANSDNNGADMGNADVGGTAYRPSNFFDNITVAATMDDAFAGASGVGVFDGDDDVGGDFVSPTKAITVGNMWYGTLLVTDHVGVEMGDYTKDIIAKIGETSDGYEYLEVYTDSSMSDDSIVLSLYVTVYDDHLEANIGNEDAWIFSRYILPGEAMYFSPELDNGALDMSYTYEEPDGIYTCEVRIFLREDYAPWDEANDPLPPSYDEYKETIN